MPVKVREANSSDVEQVLELFSRLPSRHRVDEYKVDQTASSSVYHRILENPILGVILVAELDSVILGVITLSYPVAIRSGGHYARIEEYIVDEDSRGLGIGGKLLDEAINMAKSMNCFDLQVNNPSELGKSLYTRRGFQDGDEYWRLKL